MNGERIAMCARPCCIFPLFTQFSADEDFSYLPRSKLVGELSTDPQISSQQQGSIVYQNSFEELSVVEFVIMIFAVDKIC
jgi:hypothetical protein